MNRKTKDLLTAVLLVIFLSVGMLFSNGCTSPETSNEILTRQGYTDIQITGHDFFACSEDDYSSTGFIASSISGDQVEGAVCCGLLKYCTVRLK